MDTAELRRIAGELTQLADQLEGDSPPDDAEETLQGLIESLCDVP